MANFNDLPEDVRKQIYRLHLCYDEPITSKEHDKIIQFKYKYGGDKNQMPPIMTLSKKIEKEAAPFYYRENHFENLTNLWTQLYYTWPRHVSLIRKLTVQWDERTTSATYMFDLIRPMKGLEELCIRTDEKEMVLKRLRSRKKKERFAWSNSEITPQQNLVILQHPGMAGLLKISGLKRVEFLKKKKASGEEYGGPILGGVLETQIAPKLMGPKSSAGARRTKAKTSGSASTFDFLGLSPELRNRIYDSLLCFPGPIQLTNGPPSSTPKKGKAPESALSLLAVNRQIHDEAVGIFYHYNTFTFQWTTHLLSFLLSLGPQRKSLVRSLTIHYIHVSSGGISLVDLAFPMLKQLTGLRKLEVILHGELANKVQRRYWGGNRASIKSANPALIPGLKTLFELRGVEGITVRDELLDERYEKLKGEASFPKFNEGTKEAGNLQVYKALEHFGAALRLAQKGLVCDEVLEDNQWHTKAEFPDLPVDDQDEDGESGSESDLEEIEPSSEAAYAPSMELGDPIGSD